MKTIFIAIFISFFVTEIFPQPLNGSYTIGGNSPDFTTLQEAANALKLNGVSGAVFFNIRPGTYSKNGGNNTVLTLDSIVTGLSSSNRVTFQADDAAGGNVDNVVLEMNITNVATGDPRLVVVSLDYVTFHNMTFREADASLHLAFNRLVDLTTSFYNTPSVDGVEFDGCKFIGTDPISTETGIALWTRVNDITVRENIFIRLAIGVECHEGPVSEDIVIESNQFLAGWRTTTPGGAAVFLYGQNLIIRKNIIDFNESSTGGYLGIYANIIDATQYLIIEENLIKGHVSQAIYLYGYVGADSTLIANNILNIAGDQVWANESPYGIRVLARNATIVFNTVVLSGGGAVGLGLYGDNCNVFNNIIIDRATSSPYCVYDQGNNAQSLNLQSDYNVIYTISPGNALVISDGIPYWTLEAYQNATLLDTNSVSQDIEFVAFDDLHLTECQSQDPNLRGIPIPGITNDFDEEIRNETSPMMGADENTARMNDMFGDPFTIGLPGTAFSIASAPFDNLLADGFAVPDFDNKQVLLFHYNGDRTYSHSATIQTLYEPTVVKFFDVDSDNDLDLIIGFYANWLQICWGDGTGGFPTNTLSISPGHVRSMEVGNDNFFNVPNVFLTIDDSGFPPQRSFLGYIDDNNFSVGLVRKAGTTDPDTIYSVMDDIAIANLDSELNDEIVALTVGTLGEVYIFNDSTNSSGYYPYGTHYRYVFGNTASYGTSSIHIDDFDGDGDNDFITTGYDSDELVLFRNLGNLAFADEEIITRQTDGFVVMDYENDGDKDIVTMNERLETNGITVFLNDGFGNFTTRENCYFQYANGVPWSIIASDFDLDGRTDIAITSTNDSLFVLYNLGGGTVGIQDEETEEIPTEFSLSQNFPNPFNPTTTIQFLLPKSGDVTLKIYNLLGEEVKTLVNEYKEIGNHSVQFNANNLASGMYLYRLQSGDFIEVKKMIFLK